jgi:hypothetical protein
MLVLKRKVLRVAPRTYMIEDYFCFCILSGTLWHRCINRFQLTLYAGKRMVRKASMVRIPKIIAVATGALFLLMTVSQLSLFAYAQTNNPIVTTPMGKTHADCVHEVPSGSTTVSPNTFRTPNGQILSFPNCSDPMPSSFPTCSEGAASASYTYSGTLGEIEASWTVPDNPSNPGSGDLFYIWPGLIGGSGCAYVIQPLIQWGSNGLYGGKYYSMSSWYYEDTSDYYYSSPVEIYAGDSISAYAAGGGCNGSGVCSTWDISISDSTESTNTGFTCTSYSEVCSQSYTTAEFAFEANGVSSCSNDLPASPDVIFSSITVANSGGTGVTPSWTFNHSSGCSYDAMLSGTKNVELSW